MTNERTRVLAIVAGVAVGLFLLDKVVSALVIDPWTKINLDMAKTENEIRRANATLNSEDSVQRDWIKVRNRLEEPRVPDVHTSFMSHLGELFQKAGVAFDVSENPQSQQQGD